MLNNQAIILIPGFGFNDGDFTLYFLGKLKENLDDKQNKWEGYESLNKNDFDIKRFKYNNIIIDVYEASWNDIVSAHSRQNLLIQLSLSLNLLFYWSFSSVWQLIFKFPRLIIQFIIAIAILLCWQLSTILLIISSIIVFFKSTTIEITSFLYLNQLMNLIGHHQISDSNLIEIGIYIWILSSAILILLPFSINEIIDPIFFLKDYLEKDILKYRVRDKILKIIDAVLLDSSYSKITIISHSFGVYIGADVLASLSEKYNKKQVNYLTFGNNLMFLSGKRKHLISDTIRNCITTLEAINDESRTHWTEYYYHLDFICSKIFCSTIDNNRENLKQYSINYSPKLLSKSRSNPILGIFLLSIHFLKGFFGFYHYVYFDKEVFLPHHKEPLMKAILDKHIVASDTKS